MIPLCREGFQGSYAPLATTVPQRGSAKCSNPFCKPAIQSGSHFWSSMVTSSPAADFQNQLIAELMWSFIAQAECMIKCSMELHRAECSQKIQIKPAENKTVMAQFCQPSAHPLSDKRGLQHLSHLFLMELISQLEFELPPHLGCNKIKGSQTWHGSFGKVSVWNLRGWSYLWLLEKTQWHLFPTVNMPQLPHCHSQKRPGIPAVPGIDATCVWRTLPQPVEFNWDTDGINFVVLTLTVPLMMHQGFLVLSSLAAARGRGVAVMAASQGTICTETSRSDPAFLSTCGFSRSSPRLWLVYSYRNISTAGWIALDFFKGWE